MTVLTGWRLYLSLVLAVLIVACWVFLTPAGALVTSIALVALGALVVAATTLLGHR